MNILFILLFLVILLLIKSKERFINFQNLILKRCSNLTNEEKDNINKSLSIIENKCRI